MKCANCREETLELARVGPIKLCLSCLKNGYVFVTIYEKGKLVTKYEWRNKIIKVGQ